MAPPKEPAIPLGMVDYLESLYPDRCPLKESTDREIWIDVGEANVVRHIKNLWTRQQKNILNTLET